MLQCGRLCSRSLCFLFRRRERIFSRYNPLLQRFLFHGDRCELRLELRLYILFTGALVTATRHCGGSGDLVETGEQVKALLLQCIATLLHAPRHSFPGCFRLHGLRQQRRSLACIGSLLLRNFRGVSSTSACP